MVSPELGRKTRAPESRKRDLPSVVRAGIAATDPYTADKPSVPKKGMAGRWQWHRAG